MFAATGQPGWPGSVILESNSLIELTGFKPQHFSLVSLMSNSLIRHLWGKAPAWTALATEINMQSLFESNRAKLQKALLILGGVSLPHVFRAWSEIPAKKKREREFMLRKNRFVAKMKEVLTPRAKFPPPYHPLFLGDSVKEC